MDVEDNYRKTILQTLAAAGGAIAAGITYFQYTSQQQSTQALLISNQTSKGFEELGSDKVATRLGGIYALEGVMNTSEQYHQPVLEALCAFVREGTIGMIVNEEGPATDMQAVLTVIGRRGPGKGGVSLASVRIPGAILFDADLFDADLERAILSRAILIRANLFRADLFRADLSGATLSRANLSRADLSGVENLTQAQLDQACGTDAKLPEGLTLKPCQ